MNVCPQCENQGLPMGCPSCGIVNHHAVKAEPVDEAVISDFRIPMYYRRNLWDSYKIVRSNNQMTNAVLTVIDKMVKSTSEGKMLDASSAIMLPYGHGKKTAMYSIIQNYLKHEYTVAPVMDIATLAVLENNFKANDKKAMESWNEMIYSDLVCIVGVDFSARYHTMKLFLNLCKVRALRDRPTLLFAEHSVSALTSHQLSNIITPENNLSNGHCKLSTPLILDGIV